MQRVVYSFNVIYKLYNTLYNELKNRILNNSKELMHKDRTIDKHYGTQM